MQTKSTSRTTYVGLGLTIHHDRMDRQALDNVMPIIQEEQVATWELLGDEIIRQIQRATGAVDFVDVGTGSGFWAIKVAQMLRGQRPVVYAIDEVRRSYNFARRNAEANAVEIVLKLGSYDQAMLPWRSVKAIFMNPPYHIYPPGLETLIPTFARGGSMGFEDFRTWLTIADEHLSSDGAIFFHQMCLGKDEPEFMGFIPTSIAGNPSILYYDLLPPIDVTTFLTQVYGGNHPDFSSELCSRFTTLHYTSGIIQRDGLGQRERRTAPPDLLNGKTWQDRIQFHRGVARRLRAGNVRHR